LPSVAPPYPLIIIDAAARARKRWHPHTSVSHHGLSILEVRHNSITQVLCDELSLRAGV
jgi:hypothetical protein